jgi:hypothetical protein
MKRGPTGRLEKGKFLKKKYIFKKKFQREDGSI